MRIKVAELALAALVAGCSSTDEKSSYRVGAGSPEFTLNCPTGLAECHQLARQYCGTAGYREVRRPGSGGYTTAGGGDSRTEELLSRTDRRTAGQQSMTIACKTPKPGE